MKLSVFNTRGKEIGVIKVDERVFGIKPNQAVVHQALLAHLANRRAGTASTKTRGEVRGSTVKIRIQKGIGRARLGSIRSPLMRHGGVVFGPKPRSYTQRLPKRMRRLAVRSVLSDKLAEGRLRVLDALTLEKPRTKDVLAVLGALDFHGSTLIVTGQPDHVLSLGARNIPETKVMPAAYLNVVDMLSHRGLLMTVEAVRTAERLWGGERALRRRAAVPPPEAVAAPIVEKVKRARPKGGSAARVSPPKSELAEGATRRRKAEPPPVAGGESPGREAAPGKPARPKATTGRAAQTRRTSRRKASEAAES